VPQAADILNHLGAHVLDEGFAIWINAAGEDKVLPDQDDPTWIFFLGSTFKG
jgi:hypothetical protein